MSHRLIRIADVRGRTGLGDSTIYKLMSFGEFPTQVFLTKRSVAWVESEIDAWVAARMDASRAPTSNT